MQFFQRLFPELRLFASEAGAAEAWRRVREEVSPFRPLWLVLLAALLIPNSIFLKHRFTLADLLIGTALLVTFIIGLGNARRLTHDVLRRILQEKGVPICIGCGYDCRGLQDPRCPECGREFDRSLLQVPGVAATAGAEVAADNPQPTTHNQQRTTDN